MPRLLVAGLEAVHGLATNGDCGGVRILPTYVHGDVDVVSVSPSVVYHAHPRSHSKGLPPAPRRKFNSGISGEGARVPKMVPIMVHVHGDRRGVPGKLHGDKAQIARLGSGGVLAGTILDIDYIRLRSTRSQKHQGYHDIFHSRNSTAKRLTSQGGRA